jgi:hypothetical protein
MPVYPPQCSYMPVTGGSAALVAVWQCGSVLDTGACRHTLQTAHTERYRHALHLQTCNAATLDTGACSTHAGNVH